MRKLFTLILMAAMMPWCASAQDPTQLPLGGGWNAGFVGDADVYSYSVEKQWGAAEFACNVLSADYPKFILEFEEPLAANFQVNYLWKASADAEGDATPAYGRAVGDGEKKSFELYFDSEHAYITGVSVQHTDEVAADLKIKKLTLVSASGEKKISPSFTSWAGTDNTVYYNGVVSYNKQWQQIQIKDVAGKKDLTIKVELAENVANVQMCVDYEDGTSEWPSFNDGKEVTFTTKEGAIIKTIGVQYSGEEVETPVSVAVVGAWNMTPTGISDVKVAAGNDEFVNAAGQKVGKNYKGIVINKATGKKFINK